MVAHTALLQHQRFSWLTQGSLLGPTWPHPAIPKRAAARCFEQGACGESRELPALTGSMPLLEGGTATVPRMLGHSFLMAAAFLRCPGSAASSVCAFRYCIIGSKL